MEYNPDEIRFFEGLICPICKNSRNFMELVVEERLYPFYADPNLVRSNNPVTYLDLDEYEPLPIQFKGIFCRECFDHAPHDLILVTKEEIPETLL